MAPYFTIIVNIKLWFNCFITRQRMNVGLLVNTLNNQRINSVYVFVMSVGVCAQLNMKTNSDLNWEQRKRLQIEKYLILKDLNFLLQSFCVKVVRTFSLLRKETWRRKKLSERGRNARPKYETGGETFAV